MSSTFLMIVAAGILLLAVLVSRSGRSKPRDADGGSSSGGDGSYDTTPACDSGFSCDSAGGDGGGGGD